MAPLQEFVCDSRGARGRFVGHAGKVARDLLIGDRCEILRGKGGRVRGVGIRDQLRDDGEESV